MSRIATKVAFVATKGISNLQTYLDAAESYKRQLNRETRPTFRQGEVGPKAFEVEVFTDAAAALKYLEPQTGGTRTLVFLSYTEYREAVEIAKKHHGLKVMVFTASSPEAGKVEVVQKSWISLEKIKDVVE